MDAVGRFAAEVGAFRAWALGDDAGAAAARNALLRITRLYLAALELPPAWSDELVDRPDAGRVGNAEWRAVLAAARRLPLDEYGTVFDPTVVPPEHSATVGSLSDDITDIYRDVVSGLCALEAGRRAEAVWEWGFGFCHHWGEHATGAIRALHAWLAANAADRLSSDTGPSVGER